jgi:hypothetical protein
VPDETSLRANGARESAPDDRLRESNPEFGYRSCGLLRRFAPRSDGKYQLIAVVLAVKQIPVFGANAGARLRNS